jgi:hypothetical protein
MTTLAAPETADTVRGWETVGELRRVLRDLGADDDLLRRVLLRTDLGGRQYVSVPPLPTDIVAHLARLLPRPAVR